MFLLPRHFRLLHHPPRWPAGALLLMLALGLLSACGGTPPPRNELFFIRPDQHQIANPSATAGRATGTACGDERRVAEHSAQRTAEFNLRTLTGEAVYRTELQLLRVYPENGKICVEIEARAIPTRRSRTG